MVVEFLSSFSKDLSKLASSSVRESVKKLILKLEAAKSLTDIPNVKKLAGYQTAYRIRIGDYRVGFFFENNIILLARIVHRKDIYKVFP